MIDTYILLVEDEPGSSAMEAEYLKGNGCRVDLVNSRKAAVEAVKISSYDLVVFDCKHTNLTNGDVIDWMGDLVGITPMLIITERYDPDRDSEAIETGVLFYMIRGSGIDYLHSLRNTIRHSIHNFRLKSENSTLEKELSGNRKTLNSILQSISEPCYLWERDDDGSIRLANANLKAESNAAENKINLRRITLDEFCSVNEKIYRNTIQAFESDDNDIEEIALDLPASGSERSVKVQYIRIRLNSILMIIHDIYTEKDDTQEDQDKLVELENRLEERSNELNLVNSRLQLEMSERRTVEDELRRREQHLFQFLDSVPVGIFILDADGKAYFTNKSAENILNKTSDFDVTADNLGEVYQAYLSGTDQIYPANRMPVIRALSGERCSVVDMELHRGDDVIPLEVWATPIFDESGDVAFALAAFIDVSVRRRNEREINRLNQYLESIIDNADICLYVLDRNASVILWNKAAEQISGYSREEVVGHGMIWNWLYPDEKYLGQINRKIEEVLYNGVSLVDFITVIERKDGVKRTVSWNSRPLYDEKNESIGAIALGRDVTEQRKTEEALVEKTYELTERIKELTCLSNITELLTDRNKPLEELLKRAIKFIPSAFQYAEDACVRLKIDDLVIETKKFKETDWRLGQNIEIDGKSVGCIELFYKVEHPPSDIGPFLEQERQLLSIIAGRIELIVERERVKQANRELEIQLSSIQLSEAIGLLAGGIAHELNTPAQFINDNLQFLKETYDDISSALKRQVEIIRTICSGGENDPVKTAELLWREMDIDYLMEEIPNAVRESLEGISRISKIVKAMRDFVSITPEEEYVSINVNDIIENVITISRNEWKQAADLTTELEKNLPTVRCMPGDLSLAIMILIVNAAYSIKGKIGIQPNDLGKIRIETCRSKGSVEVRITDSGLGIAENRIAKIFEPDFIGAEAGKLVSHGLPVAHSIVVNKLGGSIEVESELDRGTTFTLRFPIESKKTSGEGN